MNKDIQNEINLELLDYCERLEKKNKKLSGRLDDVSKRLDDYVDILEAMAKIISK